MGTTIDHTDQGKEESRHQTMREHLQDSTRDSGLTHHEQGKEHQSTVRHRRVGIDILQVSLHTSTQGTIDHRDGGEDEEDPREILCSLRQQVHGHTETAIASELHQHTGMEHRHGGRRRGMTVGRPCVEREQGSQHTEADEDEGEEDVLYPAGDGVGCSNRRQFERVVAAILAVEEVDTQQTENQQGRASHQHECQFHSRVLLMTRAPDTNQEVHRDKGHLVEHEHCEEVGGDEEAEHTGREQREP